eukprot:Platyproteum_vivax@DN7350_c0_g1_i10.p1
MEPNVVDIASDTESPDKDAPVEPKNSPTTENIEVIEEDSDADEMSAKIGALLDVDNDRAEYDDEPDYEDDEAFDTPDEFDQAEAIFIQNFESNTPEPSSHDDFEATKEGSESNNDVQMNGNVVPIETAEETTKEVDQKPSDSKQEETVNKIVKLPAHTLPPPASRLSALDRALSPERSRGVRGGDDSEKVKTREVVIVKENSKEPWWVKVRHETAPQPKGKRKPSTPINNQPRMANRVVDRRPRSHSPPRREVNVPPKNFIPPLRNGRGMAMRPPENRVVYPSEKRVPPFIPPDYRPLSVERKRNRSPSPRRPGPNTRRRSRSRQATVNSEWNDMRPMDRGYRNVRPPERNDRPFMERPPMDRLPIDRVPMDHRPMERPRERPIDRPPPMDRPHMERVMDRPPMERMERNDRFWPPQRTDRPITDRPQERHDRPLPDRAHIERLPMDRPTERALMERPHVDRRTMERREDRRPNPYRVDDMNERAPVERQPMERPPMDRPPMDRRPIERREDRRPTYRLDDMNERAPVERQPMERPPMDRPPMDRRPIERREDRRQTSYRMDDMNERAPVERQPMERPPMDRPPMDRRPIERREDRRQTAYRLDDIPRSRDERMESREPAWAKPDRRPSDRRPTERASMERRPIDRPPVVERAPIARPPITRPPIARPQIEQSVTMQTMPHQMSIQPYNNYHAAASASINDPYFPKPTPAYIPPVASPAASQLGHWMVHAEQQQYYKHGGMSNMQNQWR